MMLPMYFIKRSFAMNGLRRYQDRLFVPSRLHERDSKGNGEHIARIANHGPISGYPLEFSQFPNPASCTGYLSSSPS
jgi:hypothetical protein